MAQELELFTPERIREEIADRISAIASMLADDAKRMKSQIESGSNDNNGIEMPAAPIGWVSKLAAWQRRLRDRLERVDEGTLLEVNRQRLRRREYRREEKPDDSSKLSGSRKKK